MNVEQRHPPRHPPLERADLPPPPSSPPCTPQNDHKHPGAESDMESVRNNKLKIKKTCRRNSLSSSVKSKANDCESDSQTVNELSDLTSSLRLSGTQKMANIMSFLDQAASSSTAEVDFDFSSSLTVQNFDEAGNAEVIHQNEGLKTTANIRQQLLPARDDSIGRDDGDDGNAGDESIGGQQGIDGYSVGTDFDGSREGLKEADDFANSVFSSIKEKMLSMKIQLDDKSHTIELLQESVSEAKRRADRTISVMTKKQTADMKAQKKQYEQTIQRHLSFVDKLLEDKERMSKNCEDLSKELKKLIKSHKEKVMRLAEEHKKDLKRHKDNWISAEKVKRDNWMKAKTKSIKEITVKGLEPEIQKLIAKNKRNLTKQKEDFEDLLRRQSQENSIEFEARQQRTKEALTKERDFALQKEREIASIRITEQSQRFDNQFHQQRLRFHKELEEQKERFQMEKVEEEKKLKKVVQKAKREGIEELERLKSKQSEVIDDLKRRHLIEICNTKERWILERDRWEQKVILENQEKLKTNEVEFRSALTKERDEQIEMIISRFQDEAEESQQQTEKEQQNIVEQLKEKFAKELAVEKSKEKEWIEKYEKASKALLELQAKYQDVQSESKQNEKQSSEDQLEVSKLNQMLAEEKQKVEQLENDLNNIKLTTRRRDEFEEIENKLKMEQKKNGDLILARTEQITAMEQRKNDELDEVEQRVMVAISKRDEAIQQLQQELRTKGIRIQETEKLIRQQREQLVEQFAIGK